METKVGVQHSPEAASLAHQALSGSLEGYIPGRGQNRGDLPKLKFKMKETAFPLERWEEVRMPAVTASIQHCPGSLRQLQ